MALVLVVDDSSDACELLARILRRSGHEAACQTSPHEALVYLQSHLPDLVILDVMMPEMTGLEILKALRANARTASVAVVIFTALSDERTRAEAQRLGANGFVVKGGGWVDLSEEIQKHIGPHPVRPNPGASPEAP